MQANWFPARLIQVGRGWSLSKLSSIMLLLHLFWLLAVAYSQRMESPDGNCEEGFCLQETITLPSLPGEKRASGFPKMNVTVWCTLGVFKVGGWADHEIGQFYIPFVEIFERKGLSDLKED